MAIAVTCPECSKSLRLKDALAGKRIRCPACEAAITVEPAGEEEAGAAGNERADSARPRRRRPRVKEGEEAERPVRSKRSGKPAAAKKDKSKAPSQTLIWLGAGGAVAAIVVVLVLALGGSDETNGNGSEPNDGSERERVGDRDTRASGGPISVSAQQLAIQWKHNEAAAKSKFENRTVTLTGSVKEWTLQDNVGLIQISLDGAHHGEVRCNLDPPHPNQSARTLQRVKVQGRFVGGKPLEAELNHCVILEVNGKPVAAPGAAKDS